MISAPIHTFTDTQEFCTPTKTYEQDQSKSEECYLSKLVTGAFTSRRLMCKRTLPSYFFRTNLHQNLYTHISLCMYVHMCNAHTYSWRQCLPRGERIFVISDVCSRIKSNCERLILTIYTRTFGPMSVTRKSCLSFLFVQ